MGDVVGFGVEDENTQESGGSGRRVGRTSSVGRDITDPVGASSPEPIGHSSRRDLPQRHPVHPSDGRRDPPESAARLKPRQVSPLERPRHPPQVDHERGAFDDRLDVELGVGGDDHRRIRAGEGFGERL